MIFHQEITSKNCLRTKIYLRFVVNRNIAKNIKKIKKNLESVQWYNCQPARINNIPVTGSSVVWTVPFIRMTEYTALGNS